MERGSLIICIFMHKERERTTTHLPIPQVSSRLSLLVEDDPLAYFEGKRILMIEKTPLVPPLLHEMSFYPLYRRRFSHNWCVICCEVWAGYPMWMSLQSGEDDATMFSGLVKTDSFADVFRDIKLEWIWCNIDYACQYVCQIVWRIVCLFLSIHRSEVCWLIFWGQSRPW